MKNRRPVSKGGIGMKRISLLALVIFAFTPCLALAQKDVKLEFEGRYWFTDLEGRVKVTEADIGTDINFKKDLDIKDEGYPEVRLTWYTGKKSKIRLAYTQVGYDGDKNLTKTVEFNGETYNIGTRIETDFDIKYLRLGWAWQFINIRQGLVKLGTLVEGKVFWVKGSLEAPDLSPPVKESESFFFGLPTIGVALDINPHRILNIFAEGSGMYAGSYGYIYDAEAGVKLIPIKILTLLAGYRILGFEGKVEHDFARVRVYGPFVGVTVRF
jgi:hypothetical protein